MFERPMKTRKQGLSALLAAILAIPFLLASPALAQPPLPGGVPIEDLERTRDWVVEVDGEEVKVDVYYSEYEVAWLLRFEGGDLLVSPRGMSVQGVDPDAFSATGELSALLAPINGPGAVATFTRSRQVMAFDLDGRAYALRPAPLVLGRQSSLALEERHPSFVQKSATFRQNHDQKSIEMSAPVEKAAAEDLMVRVYFGSWSPICERIVPKLMAVEQSWGNVRFEYYGLPQPLIDDPHAVDMGITGVPTVVVFRGGEELERLMGRQLDEPSAALTRVLSGG